MSLELLIAAEARADLDDAVEWLRDQSPELPARFEAEVDRVFDLIIQNPDMFPIIHRPVRRALLRRFPYSVFFVPDELFVLITAVVHQARHPRTWQRRSPN